jgi:hypothetical protein
MSVFDKHGGAGTAVPKDKGDKHRSQIMVAGTILLVLIAYMTYVKTKTNKAAGDKGATVAPGSDYSPDMPTATSIPSGNAAPQTTVPFAAPTDTTGGVPIPQTSGTPTIGAPSQTVPPVTTPPTSAPTAQAAAPVQAPSTVPAVAKATAYHPASNPALANPVVAKHPDGAAALPGGAGFTPLGAVTHASVAKKG